MPNLENGLQADNHVDVSAVIINEVFHERNMGYVGESSIRPWGINWEVMRKKAESYCYDNSFMHKDFFTVELNNFIWEILRAHSLYLGLAPSSAPSFSSIERRIPRDSRRKAKRREQYGIKLFGAITTYKNILKAIIMEMKRDFRSNEVASEELMIANKKLNSHYAKLSHLFGRGFHSIGHTFNEDINQKVHYINFIALGYDIDTLSTFPFPENGYCPLNYYIHNNMTEVWTCSALFNNMDNQKNISKAISYHKDVNTEWFSEINDKSERDEDLPF